MFNKTIMTSPFWQSYVVCKFTIHIMQCKTKIKILFPTCRQMWFLSRPHHASIQPSCTSSVEPSVKRFSGAAGGSNRGHETACRDGLLWCGKMRRVPVSMAPDRNFCTAALTVWVITEKDDLAFDDLSFLLSKSNFLPCFIDKAQGWKGRFVMKGGDSVSQKRWVYFLMFFSN